jgi:hypothetical protein
MTTIIYNFKPQTQTPGDEIGSVTLNGTILNVNQTYASWTFLLWPLEITAILGIIIGGIFLLKAYGDWLKKEELNRQKQ